MLPGVQTVFVERRFPKCSRAVAFYVGYSTFTIGWGAASILFAWLLPYQKRFHFIVGTWSKFSLFWLKLTCGVSHQIIGAEHIPERACIVLVRHESTWETAFLQTLFAPQATLLKRELLWIPFFGWAFALLKPIAINRGNPRGALKKLIAEVWISCHFASTAWLNAARSS